MNRWTLGALILVVLFVGTNSSSRSQAAIAVFQDRDSFLVATGATSATGVLPNLGLVGKGAVTIGTVTLRSASGDLYVGAKDVLFGNELGLDWCALLPGNDIAISGDEHLDVGLAAPVFSLGFDFVEPETKWGPYIPGPGGPPTLNDTFRVSLFDGNSLVGAFDFDAPNDVLAFVGVWSDTTFSRVEVRQVSGGINDEYFGQFYSGATAVVPEPCTLIIWSFLGALAIGIGWWRKRKAA